MTAHDDQRETFGLAAAIVAAVTLLRIAVLVASPLELYPDEAQYWWWSQFPDFGYFSKPPLIAWLIGASTAVFGDREWAIRIVMPLLHAGAALLLYGTARAAFPRRRSIAFWSALAYLTLPGVSYSATLASTDAPLLFFWSLALFAFVRAMNAESWRWPLLCGFAVGMGVLAKYAMGFFLVGVVLAAVVEPAFGRRLFRLRWLGAGVVALVVVAPNAFWNLTHGLATVTHTQTNAGWSRASFNPVHLAGFLAGQFGVFGPVLMAAWIARLVRLARGEERDRGQILLAALSLPTLALIAVQAFIADANANWAATSYVAAVPLAIAELQTRWPRAWLQISFVLHATVLALLCVVLVSPATADRIWLGNVFKRQEGWRAIARQVSEVGLRDGYPLIVTANRSVTAEFLYYMRDRASLIRIWDPDLANHNHFEMTMRLVQPAPRALLVLAPEDAAEVLPTFESTTAMGDVSVPVGGRHLRRMRLFDARGYRGPRIHPLR